MDNAENIQKRFLLCCGIAESVHIECSLDKLGINNLDEFKRIFHSKLKKIYFRRGLFGLESFDTDGINVKTDNKNESKDDDDEVGMLEEIHVDTHGGWEGEWSPGNTSDTIMTIFKFFDKLGMRRNITRYELEWRTYDTLFNETKHHDCDKLLNGILFQDWGKHPLLESIRFSVTIGGSLRSILLHLISHGKELFIEKSVKSNLKYFRTIELDIIYNGFLDIYIQQEIDNSLSNKYQSYCKTNCVDSINVNTNLNTNEGKQTKFSIDETAIEIKNVSQCIGFINHNILDWLKRIQEAHQNVYNRKVVLVV